MRAHQRKDLEYVIVKASRVYFSRVGYACVITQSTAYPDERAIYHIETFYGNNGVETRAKARRYGRSIVGGAMVAGYRNQYLPVEYSSKGLPKPENAIEVRFNR